MSTYGKDRKVFGTTALLASVTAWLAERPLVAPLVTGVQVYGDGTGSDVSLQVTGDLAELRIMADALGVSWQAAGDVRDCHVRRSEGDERWWRQGGIMITLPNGEHWSVTVTRELDAPGLTEVADEAWAAAEARATAGRFTWTDTGSGGGYWSDSEAVSACPGEGHETEAEALDCPRCGPGMVRAATDWTDTGSGPGAEPRG